jgi:hypothetical protein
LQLEERRVPALAISELLFGDLRRADHGGSDLSGSRYQSDQGLTDLGCDGVSQAGLKALDLLAAAAIVLVLLFLTAPIADLPKAVLGAVMITAAIGLIELTGPAARSGTVAKADAIARYGKTTLLA